MTVRSIHLATTALIAMLGSAAFAFGPSPSEPIAIKGAVMVTSPELGDGFRDRAACEAALGGSRGMTQHGVRTAPGSLFNRRYHNVSRCELIEGEYQLVVEPRA